MPMDAHMEALRKRHRDLDSQLKEMAAAPGAKDSDVALLKREKLKLKDEIERLNRRMEVAGH